MFEAGDFDVERVEFLLDFAQLGGFFDFCVFSQWGGLFFLAIGVYPGLGERGFELGELGSLGHDGTWEKRLDSYTVTYV